MFKYLIIAVSFFLGACGGSSSSPSPTPSSLVAEKSSVGANSSKQSSSSVDAYWELIGALPVQEKTYHTQEDKSLAINAIGGFWLVNDSWRQIPSLQRDTLMGGVVVAAYSDQEFTYTPKEDFNGTDEFYIVDMINTGKPQRIKVIVEVAPVEDVLEKWKFAKPLELYSGKQQEIPFPIDPDTGLSVPVDNSAILTLGGKILPYKLSENKFIVDIPVLERAGIYELGVRLGTVQLSADVPCVIVDGATKFYMGNKNSPGSLWVLVRTDLVSDAEYYKWIQSSVIPLLYESLIKAHSSYTSFAVIEPQAEQHIYINKYVEGIGLVGGADSKYYSSFVDQFLPRHNQIIVLDAQEFRATGGYPITVNVFDSKGVLFHELGHAHARLGDEYVENCTQKYANDAYPNIESDFFGGIDIIQWKHWIADSARIPGFSSSEISPVDTGVFLGAFYCSDRYYRPAFKTLMKDSTQPPSAVDKEAWLLANYFNMGILDSLVSEQKNGMNRLRLSRTFDSSVTSIRWFLNNNELGHYEGKDQIEIDEAQLAGTIYSIRAELVDLTGMVRNPHAYIKFNDFVIEPPFGRYLTDLNSRFKRTWNFSVNPPAQKLKATARQAAPISSRWAEHKIEIEFREHKLVASRRYTAEETMQPVMGGSDLLAEVIVDGVVVSRIGMELKRFHQAQLTSPLIDNRFYKLVHPAIDHPYKIHVYSLPAYELVATFEFID